MMPQLVSVASGQKFLGLADLQHSPYQNPGYITVLSCLSESVSFVAADILADVDPSNMLCAFYN